SPVGPWQWPRRWVLPGRAGDDLAAHRALGGHQARHPRGWGDEVLRPHVKKRLLICSVLVAVVGLSSALLIYLTAGEDSGGDEGFQTIVVDGKTFKIPMASTKMYQ